MSRGYDSNVALNISANTPGFHLDGGVYFIVISATFGGGTVGLQVLSADDATYMGVHTALAANGAVSVTLSPGTYRWRVVTATAVYASVVGVPID